MQSQKIKELKRQLLEKSGMFLTKESRTYVNKSESSREVAFQKQLDEDRRTGRSHISPPRSPVRVSKPVVQVPKRKKAEVKQVIRVMDCPFEEYDLVDTDIETTIDEVVITETEPEKIVENVTYDNWNSITNPVVEEEKVQPVVEEEKVQPVQNPSKRGRKAKEVLTIDQIIVGIPTDVIERQLYFDTLPIATLKNLCKHFSCKGHSKFTKKDALLAYMKDNLFI
jgi:hypothetical protein